MDTHTHTGDRNTVLEEFDTFRVKSDKAVLYSGEDITSSFQGCLMHT